jgi:hypothetical protein
MRLTAARRLACALGLAVLASASAAAEEVKVMQGLYLQLAGTESETNAASPFARFSTEAKDWDFSPYSYSSYNLRFQTRSVAAQVLASAQGDSLSSFKLSVDQAWVKATFGEGWAMAFGRRELKWKDGGYWNPSDIVNNKLAWGVAGLSGAGEAAGRDSIEAFGLIPLMDLNIDISAATVFSGDLSSPDELPLYIAAGSIIYPFEFRTKAAFMSDRLPLVGASARWTLESGEVYVDGLWLEDGPIAADFGVGPSNGSWFRYCAGAAWTASLAATKIAKTLSLQTEYLRQDDGLDSATMSSYFDGLDAADALKWGGRFFALGRDYAYARLALGDIANLHLSLSETCVLNLDDLSFALASALTWSPLGLFSICLSASNYGGSSGGEALMIPYAAQYSLTLSRSF